MRTLEGGRRSDCSQEALYACPYWVTLWIVENSLWDDEAADAMRRLTKRFLDSLARALGLDPAAREDIESAARALRGSDQDADDD
ncbi:hypothetical protein ACOXH8_37160 [Nannocystis pusilla]